MNNTPFGQLIIPSQAILCVCPVITRGHLPMEQHWKTFIVSSCLTQKTTQFHQFHHVSKFHHPFLKTAWPFWKQFGLSTAPTTPVSALSQAPALPWEAGDLGFHLADGRAVDLYAHLLLASDLGDMEKIGRKNQPRESLEKCLLRGFLPQIMRIICLTHCESWFSNVMIIKGSWEAILPSYEWLLLDGIDYDEEWCARETWWNWLWWRVVREWDLTLMKGGVRLYTT